VPREGGENVSKIRRKTAKRIGPTSVVTVVNGKIRKECGKTVIPEKTLRGNQ